MSPKRLCHCLICLKEVSSSSYSPRLKTRNHKLKVKQNLCQRFCVIMSRYLNSKPSFFSKLEKTLNPNNQEYLGGQDEDEFSKFGQLCCDECGKWLESICEIYQEWTSLQLKLNDQIRSLAQLMMESANGIFNQEMKINECDENGRMSEFREMYLERVLDKKAAHDLPHLSLEKCEFLQKLAEPGPEVDFVKKEISNSDQDEDEDDSTVSMDVDIEEQLHYASNKTIKVEVDHYNGDDDEDEDISESAEFEIFNEDAEQSDDGKKSEKVSNSTWFCDKCGKECLTKTGFLKHQKSQSHINSGESSQSQFVCDMCGKSYRNKTCFFNHQIACYKKGEREVSAPAVSRKETTVETRESVVKAWEDAEGEKTYQDLAVQFKLRLTTVFSIINRYKEYGTFTNRSGRGSHPKLTDEQCSEILEKVRENPNISTMQLKTFLQQKYGIIVSCQTVRNYLRKRKP